jgi:PAS domain S-box-containing protein
LTAWPAEADLAAAVVASSPLAVVVVDGDRVVRAFNGAAERLTGRPATEVVGGPLARLFPSELVGDSLAQIEAAGRGRGTHLELVMCTSEDDRVPIGISWGPLEHAGRRVGLVGVGRDITRRKQLEHELAEMAGGLRELGSVSDLGMYRFAFEPELQVRYANPAFEQMLAVSVADLQQDPSPLWSRLPAEAWAELSARRLGERPVRGPIETTWVRPDDGSTIHLEIREAPLRDAHGHLVGALGLVTDVTVQHRQRDALAETLRLEREASEELRRVDELRRLFLQAVSHELRTPLTSVLGFASTLRYRYDQLPREGVLEAADRIHQQSQRIERLLDDLLDIERLSRGVVDLQRQELDLGQLVLAVVAEHGDEEVEIQVPSLAARVDAGKIERIVVNLLANARRHAGADAAVLVRLQGTGSDVRLVVEDDGPGLPDELKARAFEPFEQGPQASAAASPGTGIGLTLVREFARLHGGAAWAEDSDLGGARFVVELPRAVDEPDEAADGASR